MVNLGEMPNRALALKAGTIDAAMLSVPYDLFMEKDGFKPIAYLKDILEFPLLGLIVHDERIKERPEEVKKVLTAALKGIAYKPLGAAAILRRNLLVYGAGGVVLPFIGIKAIDMMLVAAGLA